VEHLTVQQRAGERRFASIVELLENDRGERLVRFAYSTGGAVRRGPVTLRARDVERLHAALAKTPDARRRARAGRRLDDSGERHSSGIDQRAEDQCSVGRAEQRVDRVLGMRHQTEDVALGVQDAGHVGDRPIRVRAVRVAESDLVGRVEVREQLVVGRTSSLRRA